jgi:hypothetical protein
MNHNLRRASKPAHLAGRADGFAMQAARFSCVSFSALLLTKNTSVRSPRWVPSKFRNRIAPDLLTPSRAMRPSTFSRCRPGWQWNCRGGNGASNPSAAAAGEPPNGLRKLRAKYATQPSAYRSLPSVALAGLGGGIFPPSSRRELACGRRKRRVFSHSHADLHLRNCTHQKGCAGETLRDPPEHQGCGVDQTSGNAGTHPPRAGGHGERHHLLFDDQQPAGTHAHAFVRMWSRRMRTLSA